MMKNENCFSIVGSIPSKPGMRVHKPSCLLRSKWVGLGNPGGGGVDSDFRKVL
jgi:hypothetical protein